jgi:hypothetical protein
VRPPDTLFAAAFVALTLSDLAYFVAAGVLIGVTPFFVAGPLTGVQRRSAWPSGRSA